MKPRSPRNFLLQKFSPYAFALAFFCGLGLLGFPQPMEDDLFFVGAGLNLAQDGNFSNPMLERQHFPGTHYFVHPPLHSFAVAGWLKIFGISALSLVAFQTVMYVLVCWATMTILRHYEAPRFLDWLVPLGVATAFLSIGLRPEPFSAALTMLGFGLVECFGGGEITIFFGFLLMFLGASIASRMAFFSAALALTAFVRLSQGRVPLVRMCMLAGSAMLVALLSFSCLIDFRFKEFFDTYCFHAAGRVGGDKIGLLAYYLSKLLGITQWPLIFLWLASLPLLLHLRSKNRDLARMGLFVSGVFFAMALLGALGHGMIWYAVFVLFASTTAYVRQTSPRRSMIAQLLLAAVLVVANGKNFVEILGLATGRIMTDKNIRQSSGPIPQPTRGHPLLIDSAAARYVYDYRIPDGAIDWSFAAPFPGTLAIEDLHPDDIFLLGPISADMLNQNLHVGIPIPKWSPFVLERWAFHKHPEWTYVIYAKDCLGDK